MELFSANDVSKTYASQQALTNVSIAVDEGTIFGLLGPNGAGKTTLIRIINQITAPDSGSVWFDGRKLKPEDISRLDTFPKNAASIKK